MRKVLSILHRWFGFPLGLLFVVTFGTGCLTAMDELLTRVEHARTYADYAYRSTSIKEDAWALSSILEGKKGIRQVMLPSKDAPYYQVAARGERWTYPIDQLNQEAYVQSNKEGFFRTVLQLHRNFLLGNEGFLGIGGKYYVVWVGLIALLLSLLGVWLWWSLRKSFSLKDLVPRGKKRKHFYYSHMTSGVVILVVIIVMALTGASITYRDFTQQLLGVERKNPSDMQAIDLNDNWQDWLQEAYAQMPEGARLQQIRFPRQPKGVGERQSARNNAEQKLNNRNVKSNESADNRLVKPLDNSHQSNTNQNSTNISRVNAGQQLLNFRFNAPGDWLGLAGSSVKIDKKSSQLVDVILFRNLSLSEKIYSILMPLHTGHDLPAVYMIGLLVLSFLGTVMVLSGLVSFVMKKRKWSKTRRFINPNRAMKI